MLSIPPTTIWSWLIDISVCVASICRILSLQKNTYGTDATWTMAPVFIWSCVEPFVGIICACLPTFGPFFRRWWAKVRTMRSSNSRSTNPSAEHPSTITTWLRKPRAKKPPKDSLFSINDFSCVDEVELMNVINATQSLRDEAVSDHHDVERGDSSGITVQQDVDVTWDKYKTGKKRWSVFNCYKHGPGRTKSSLALLVANMLWCSLRCTTFALFCVQYKIESTVVIYWQFAIEILRGKLLVWKHRGRHNYDITTEYVEIMHSTDTGYSVSCISSCISGLVSWGRFVVLQRRVFHLARPNDPCNMGAVLCTPRYVTCDTNWQEL